MKQIHTRKTRQQRREEALRPCPVLGYDHDDLAQYLMTRKAWKIAEDEFRRAIWLNPYEPVFLEHLIECLLELKRYADAIQIAQQLPQGNPTRRYAEEKSAAIPKQDNNHDTVST